MIINEITIKYETKAKQKDLPKVTQSNDIYNYCKEIWTDIEYVEKFVILLLNKNLKILGWKLVSQGGVSGTVVDPKIIFQTALKANASCIVMIHNHPSGNLDPSREDKKITKKIYEGGKILDIQLIDHLIISKEGYCSFIDKGLIK
jgi:DNA repair protein RadC